MAATDQMLSVANDKLVNVQTKSNDTRRDLSSTKRNGWHYTNLDKYPV